MIIHHNLNLAAKDVCSLSRRNALLAAGGALLGAGLMTGAASAAASKMAQKSVSYQEKPRGHAQCDTCNQWIAPNACKIVAGDISPTGWCTLYSPKA